MPDPLQPLGVYDFLGKEPKKAAVLQTARAMELQRQRALAGFQMNTDDPGFQAAGRERMASANQEQRALEEMGPRVLAHALGVGELGLRAKQQQFEEYKFGKELPLREKELMFKIAAPFLQAIVDSDATERTIRSYAGLFGPAVSDLAQKLLGTPAESRKQAAMGMLKNFGINMGGGAPAEPAAPPVPPAAGAPAVLGPQGIEAAGSPESPEIQRLRAKAAKRLMSIKKE